MFIRLFGAVALERFLAAVKSPETLKIPSLQVKTKAIALCSHVARTTNVWTAAILYIPTIIFANGNFANQTFLAKFVKITSRENFGHYGRCPQQ